MSRPTGLTATAVSPSEVEVTWSAVSGADGYDIQMMESGGSWGDTVDAGAGTSFSYQPVDEGVFRVSASG